MLGTEMIYWSHEMSRASSDRNLAVSERLRDRKDTAPRFPPPHLDCLSWPLAELHALPSGLLATAHTTSNWEHLGEGYRIRGGQSRPPQVPPSLLWTSRTLSSPTVSCTLLPAMDSPISGAEVDSS